MNERNAAAPPAPNGSPPRQNGISQRPPSADEIVVLREVKKEFDDQQVLKGVNFVARRKETTVIIGGSGAI